MRRYALQLLISCGIGVLIAFVLTAFIIAGKDHGPGMKFLVGSLLAILTAFSVACHALFHLGINGHLMTKFSELLKMK